MSEKQQKRYLGTEEQIEKFVKKHDIVVPRAEKSDMTVREYYCHYENFFEEDLNLFLEILSKMHPELMPYAEEYLSQNYQYYCNMFIMKKQYFNEYCNLLFPVLAEFDKRKALHGNFQADRTNGYLAERFVGIYLYYAKAQGAKIKHISRIDAYSPKKTNPLQAAACREQETILGEEGCGGVKYRHIYTEIKNAAKAAFFLYFQSFFPEIH